MLFVKSNGRIDKGRIELDPSIVNALIQAICFPLGLWYGKLCQAGVDGLFYFYVMAVIFDERFPAFRIQRR